MEWQLMTAEQKDITGLVRKFLENELAPLVRDLICRLYLFFVKSLAV